jgi:hypothetical protein
MDRYTLIVAIIAIASMFQRLLREDVKWLPTLAAPWRGLVVALGASIVTPVLDAWLNGSSIAQAALAGVIAALPTILNVIASFTANAKIAKAMLTAARLAALVTVFAVVMVACAAKNIVCPIIHAVDEICPLVIVELPDGGQEAVPRADIQQTALQHRATRLAGPDGGAK